MSVKVGEEDDWGLLSPAAAVVVAVEVAEVTDPVRVAAVAVDVAAAVAEASASRMQKLLALQV